MPDLPKVTRLQDQLAFTCTHEKDRLPEFNPEADQLFKHARWLQKMNLLKADPAKYEPIERLYRIAAAHGHYKASHNLMLLLVRGESIVDDYKTLPVELAEDLIERGIPQGYYDMGLLLQRGYGVKKDEKAALQYLRKAADLGNPEAQYYVGDKLDSLGIDNTVPYKIGKDMKRCAAEQGHAKAASDIGYNLKNNGRQTEALKYFQLATKAGSAQAAFLLSQEFLATSPYNDLALAEDKERARRYSVLQDILSGWDYLGATVDDIDEIVPLPPADLLPWDGEIKFQKEWRAHLKTPPPLPSEARIAEMARKKGLDPRTGWPVKKE